MRDAFILRTRPGPPDLGFRSFFVLWDGADADAAALLARVRHVTLAPLRLDAVPGRADASRAARFATFRGNHWQWGGRPGNYELMVKQGFCVQEAIREAHARGRNSSADWLFHMDVDEALLPRAGPRGPASVEDVLRGAPADVTSVRFLNYEARSAAPAVVVLLRVRLMIDVCVCACALSYRVCRRMRACAAGCAR